MIKKLKNILLFWGFDPRVLIYTVSGFPGYFRDLRSFRKKTRLVSAISLGKKYPVLTDKKKQGGNLTDHYFYQDLIVARRVFDNNPIRHIDIGSRIDGFVAHVASFREIEVFDIRPLNSEIPNVKFVQADFMNFDERLKECTDSVSCLHALEHFGLGRYGDPLDPEGHLKGFNSITMILKKGGKFYLSSPIGPLRVEFNAHRVFSISYLLEMFKNKFVVERFSYIDDKKVLHKDSILTPENISKNFGCTFGCGIFELRKL